MSAQPEIEQASENGAVMNLPTEQAEAWRIAQESPASALEIEVPAKVLFLAAQLGMTAAQDWETRADWVTVYLRAVGPSGDV